MLIPPFRLSFDHGWFNHYYTKSMQEFDAKNARGSATRYRTAGRRYREVPRGSDDVVNVHILRLIRARLQAMEATGVEQGHGVLSLRQLRSLLLRGALSTAAEEEAEFVAASSRAVTSDDGEVCAWNWTRGWSSDFIQAGHRFFDQQRVQWAAGNTTGCYRPLALYDPNA